MKNRKLRKQYALVTESLEARLAPAGQVMIEVRSGTMKVRGDDEANKFTIQQTGLGAFRVTGHEGETFFLNGVAFDSGDIVNGVTGDINVDLKKGNDQFVFAGIGKGSNPVDPITAVNIDIKARQGSDSVRIEEARITGNVKIDVGQGDGASELSGAAITMSSIAKMLTIKTGKSHDTVYLGGIDVIGKATIQTKDGSDSIQVVNGSTFAGMLDINAGRSKTGGDTVTIAGGTRIDGELKITTGDGRDTISFDNAFASIAKVKTGAGNDEVFLATDTENTVTVNELQADFGSGDDTVLINFLSDPSPISRLVLNGPKISKIKGGLGRDTITGASFVNGLQFMTDPLTTGVEVVNA